MEVSELISGQYVTKAGDTAYKIGVGLHHRGEAWKYFAIVNPNLLGAGSAWLDAADVELPVARTVNLPVDMRVAIGSGFKALFNEVVGRGGAGVLPGGGGVGGTGGGGTTGGGGAGSPPPGPGTTRRINPFPPTLGEDPGSDSAKYTVPLGKFQRPRLYILNGEEFEWPLGTEDMGVVGGPTMAEHKYLGDNALVVEVTHLDASRIEMSGLFPGKTGAENMRALRRLCRLPNPTDFKRLEIPGVFVQAQRVVTENYDFRRTVDDPWSWTYTVSFVVVGTSPNQNPAASGLTTGLATVNSVPAQKSMRKGRAAPVFTVKAGQQTLKSIAAEVYGDPAKWRVLLRLNIDTLQEAIDQKSLPAAATTMLPLGMKLQYIGTGA